MNHVYIYFWFAQLIVIISTSIIGFFTIGYNTKKNPEKRFLLPYCCINSIVMILLHFEPDSPQNPLYSLSIICIWVFFELLFITFYLNDKMGKKNKIIIPIIVYLITVTLSAFIFRSHNSLAFLITNVIIGVYLLSILFGSLRSSHSRIYLIPQNII